MTIFALIAQDAGNLGGTISGPGGYNPAELGTGGAIESLISNIVGFLTIIAGLMFLIYFIIGALNWITSGGDAGKVDEAKSRMTSAAIGMIITVVAYAIAWIIGSTLGINILNPKDYLDQITPGGSQQTEAPLSPGQQKIDTFEFGP